VSLLVTQPSMGSDVYLITRAGGFKEHQLRDANVVFDFALRGAGTPAPRALGPSHSRVQGAQRRERGQTFLKNRVRSPCFFTCTVFPVFSRPSLK